MREQHNASELVAASHQPPAISKDIPDSAMDSSVPTDAMMHFDEELVSAIKQELRSDFITASPQLVRGTQLRVRARAWELRQQQNNLRPLWISCVLAFTWAVVSMPFLWQGFEWLGRNQRLPEIVWQTGFVIMSLMPIAAVGTIAIANGLHGKLQKRTF